MSWEDGKDEVMAELREERDHLRAVVLRLAGADVYRSHAVAGERHCCLCGAQEGYAGLVQHADTCAYLAALAYRGERDEASDRHWNEKHAEQRTGLQRKEEAFG